MTAQHRRFSAVALAVAAAAAFGTVPLEAATRIGVAAAVRNEVQGVQGGAARELAAGSQLFELETVKTGAESAAQLIFLDETSLSIGPKAQVTLDRFVFDPNRKAGDVVLSTSRGAFRFITGSQDPRNYKIKTAVATIGVRGTILDCFQGPTWLLCILQEGGADFDVAGVIHSLSRRGQAILINQGGGVRFFTPDGTFFENAGLFAFPLYGLELDGAVRYLEVGGDLTEAIDELNSQDANPPEPPEPPEPPPPPDDDDDEPPPDDDDDTCGDCNGDIPF